MADLGLGLLFAGLAGIPGLGFTAFQGFQIGFTLASLAFPGSGPNIDGGRITEIRLGSASQGTPIPLVYGRKRVAGLVLWMSELREVSETTRVGGKGGGSRTDQKLFADIAVALCEGPVSNIRRIWANSEVIYDNRSGTPQFAEFWKEDQLEIYYGTEDQDVNSLMEAALPAGECPAYRGLCYLVLHNWPLTRFNNSTPQINVELEAGEEVSLADVLEDLLGRAGLEPGDMDLSLVEEKSVRGLIVDGRPEIRQTLDYLQTAHRFDLAEFDGQVKAIPWGGEPTIILDPRLLGIEGDEEAVKLTRAQDAELPRKVEVRYYSEAIDLQTANQSDQIEAVPTEDATVLDWPMVLTEDEAKTAAVIERSRRWVARLGATANAMPALLTLAPGDVVGVPTRIGTLTFKVPGMTLTEGGHVQLAMIEDDPAIYRQTATGAIPKGSGSASGILEAGDLLNVGKGDLPALLEAHSDQARIYAWSARLRSGWSGATWAGDAMVPTFFTPRFDIRPSCTAGITLSTLPAAGKLWRFDESATVDIELLGGSVSSKTEAEVLNGANLCIIGSEILQFVNATLIGTNRYRLSKLIRGRRGTEDLAAVSKAQGAIFALWDSAAQTHHAYMPRWLGEASGPDMAKWNVMESSIDGHEDVNFAMDDGPVRPFSPCHLKIVKDGSDDRVITWIRRVRKLGELMDGQDAPLDYDSEKYCIAIGASGASAHSTYRAFGFGANDVILGASTGSKVPNDSTALSAATYTVPAATWAGWGGGNRKIMVAQIGRINSLGYHAIGRPAMIVGGA